MMALALPRPSHQPLVCLYLLHRLTSEDLYPLDDLVEFASVLVKEGLGCGGEKGHRDPRSFADASC